MDEGFVDSVVVYSWESYRKCGMKRTVDPLEPKGTGLLFGFSSRELSRLTAPAHVRDAPVPVPDWVTGYQSDRSSSRTESPLLQNT